MNEHQLQKACVTWFDIQYPGHYFDLFAVPNGGQRNRIVAAKLKAEGVRAGIADLILDHPGAYGEIIYIELKVKKNTQTPKQKEFEKRATQKGRRYFVLRSLDEFISIVNFHLSKM